MKGFICIAKRCHLNKRGYRFMGKWKCQYCPGKKEKEPPKLECPKGLFNNILKRKNGVCILRWGDCSLCEEKEPPK